MNVARRLFPDPPRRVPAHRALGIALRTLHLLTFGTLVGGHVFDVDPDRLVPFLIATIVSGAGLVTLELAATLAWLSTAKGIAVLLKLLVLLSVPLFWEHRVMLLLLVIVVASVGAHMPSRFRNYSLLAPRASGLSIRRNRV